MKNALLAAGVPIEVLYPEFAPPQKIEGFDEPGQMVSTGTSTEAMEIMRQLGGRIELTPEDLFIDPELLKD